MREPKLIQLVPGYVSRRIQQNHDDIEMEAPNPMVWTSLRWIPGIPKSKMFLSVHINARISRLRKVIGTPSDFTQTFRVSWLSSSNFTRQAF